MKTAISVPDEVFSAVDAKAASLGISRSEFYATAARRYLAALEESALEAALNAAIEDIGHNGTDPGDQQWITSHAPRVLGEPW
jgi:hypothetical protein